MRAKLGRDERGSEEGQDDQRERVGVPSDEAIAGHSPS